MYAYVYACAVSPLSPQFDITTSRSGVTGGLYLRATVEISETKAGDSRWNTLFLVERSVPERPYQALRVPARMRKPCRRRRSVIASRHLTSSPRQSWDIYISSRIRAVSHGIEKETSRRTDTGRDWSGAWRFGKLIKTRIKLPRIHPRVAKIQICSVIKGILFSERSNVLVQVSGTNLCLDVEQDTCIWVLRIRMQNVTCAGLKAGSIEREFEILNQLSYSSQTCRPI